MDAGPTLVGILLVAAAAGFALLPLARGSGAAIVAPDAPSADRSAIYGEVLELEFDYQVGKLSAEDFHVLSTQLLARASVMMQAEGGCLGDLDEEIEREISEARAAFTAARRGGRTRRTAGTHR